MFVAKWNHASKIKICFGLLTGQKTVAKKNSPYLATDEIAVSSREIFLSAASKHEWDFN